MRLQDVMVRGLTLTPEGIKRDRELTTQIQIRLIALRLLDPAADGSFGEQTKTAFKDFQILMNLPYDGNLNPLVAESLIETKQAVSLKLGKDLASRIVKYALAKNYFVPVGPKRYFLCFVEGMNPDGSLNKDALDDWDDLAVIIECADGTPKIVADYIGSCEPGAWYVRHPLNEKGCARLVHSQFKAWQVGTHGNAQPHEALVQTGGNVKVYRDRNRDAMSSGDYMEEGKYAINIHWGFNLPKVGRASAGCMTIQMKADFMDWMKFVKSDRRYQINNRYVFMCAVLSGQDLAKKFPS